MEILGIPIMTFLIIVGASVAWALICVTGISWIASQSQKAAKQNMRHVLKQQHLEYWHKTGDENQIAIIERLTD